MEFSSPLAAMQPPPRPQFGCGVQDMASRTLFPSMTGFGGCNPFNSGEMATSNKSGRDYFSVKPVRGSSPAASLAADLSQNFHIDQSPQLPTPRRSLFTSNSIFQPLDTPAGITTPPVRWEGVTTPPIPSSSPAFGHDAMDISPLPHKAPFPISSRVNLQSPSPEATPDDEDMLSPRETPRSSSLLQVPVQRPNVQAERPKPKFRRPSLSRTKGFSTNTVSLKSNSPENPLSAFTSGGDSNSSSDSPALSLSECFAESPARDRNMFSKPMFAPRPRPSLSSFSSAFRNGSPCQPQPRKTVGACARPRKQFRRSLSMFEHPDDVMKQDNADYSPSGLQSIMDVDDTHTLQLPHFMPEGEADSLPRIETETLINVLDGQYGHIYDNVCIVDCRFEYEFEGGHIDGAVNHNDKEMLAGKLFSSHPPANTLLIFHCEYSAHRAPIMAKFVRHRDRAVNELRYPQLTYPEMYILDGGYSTFFKKHSPRCFPQNYVEMDSKEHEHACEKGMDKLRHRAKLNRAHTFAMGDSCQQDSPSAQYRSRAKGLDDSVFESNSDFRRSHARRMASY